MHSSELENELARLPLVGILRNLGPADTVRQAHRLWDAGIRIIEVTIQSEDAVPSLAVAVAAARERGMPIGAGSVIAAPHLAAAADCGVDFTVAPGLSPDVLADARKRGMLHIPGVATATEITQALAAGATIVKAFPASSLGPGWVRAQRAPFPGLRVMATGGLKPADLADYLEAGALAIGVSERAIDDGWRAERFLSAGAR